jgi:hypothetical protein
MPTKQQQFIGDIYPAARKAADEQVAQPTHHRPQPHAPHVAGTSH